LWVLDLRILAETFRFIRYSSPSRGLVSSSWFLIMSFVVIDRWGKSFASSRALQ
jgi:hypothetical protein